ncbi:MAG: RDD family protein [Cyanothece sp. SIO1E1]|nr:RDD family protein [Cyanothece sp. SIO1E1]
MLQSYSITVDGFLPTPQQNCPDYCYILFCAVIGFLLGLAGLAEIIENINDLLLGIMLNLVYFVGLESLCGRTIAKFITRTKVVTVSGQKPDFGTIFIRTLCRYIPFEPFSFLGNNPYGWHDSIPKTRVVND